MRIQLYEGEVMMPKQTLFAMLAIGFIATNAFSAQKTIEEKKREYDEWYTVEYNWKQSNGLFWLIEARNRLPERPIFNCDCDYDDAFGSYVKQVDEVSLKRQDSYARIGSELLLQNSKKYVQDRALRDKEYVEKEVSWARAAYNKSRQDCLEIRAFHRLMHDIHENGY